MKPCPKCKSTVAYSSHRTPAHAGVQLRGVVCGLCGFMGPLAATSEEAWAAWNAIPEPEPIPAPCGGKAPVSEEWAHRRIKDSIRGCSFSGILANDLIQDIILATKDDTGWRYAGTNVLSEVISSLAIKAASPPSQYVTFQNVRYDHGKTIMHTFPELCHTTNEFNPEGVYTKPVKIRRGDDAVIVPGSIRDNAGFGYNEEDEKTMSIIHVKGIGYGYLVMGTVDEVEEMLR